jgi:hypothetical protein
MQCNCEESDEGNAMDSSSFLQLSFSEFWQVIRFGEGLFDVWGRREKIRRKNNDLIGIYKSRAYNEMVVSGT